MRFSFLMIFFLVPIVLEGMVVDERATRRAALEKSFEELDEEINKLGAVAAVSKKKKRNRSDAVGSQARQHRSDAVGSQAEFLIKSLGQCSDVDYPSSDRESNSNPMSSSQSHRRSSSMDN